MGLFSSSKTTVTNTTQTTTDSYNKTLSKNDIMADSGNTTVYLNTTPGQVNAQEPGIVKYLPLLALVMFGLAALLLLTGRTKIPTPRANGLSV